MSEMSDMHKLIMAMKLAKTAQVGMELTYFDVIELLSELESLKSYIAELEKKQRWIPVSQPPTKSGKYNVLIKWKYGKVVDTAAYMTKATILGNHWFNDKYAGSAYFVTHWMPLPQPKF